MQNTEKKENFSDCVVITAGSTYMDIDAYACCVAMQELLRLKGKNAIAYSKAPCNYSIGKSLLKDGQISDVLPPGCSKEELQYIIVDVSDPEYLKGSAPLENIIEIYDHHVGFEGYWTSRLNDNAHIEFIGAAATLIFREWKKKGLVTQMTQDTAKLLIAAILDNTLDLTSSNTTKEDIETFNALRKIAKTDRKWDELYFSEVQKSIEADLKNALFGDLKMVNSNHILPNHIAQLCVWNSENVLTRLPEIREWFNETFDSWMINLIDVKQRCCYFICDEKEHQKNIKQFFGVDFNDGVAKSEKSYLRKEVIKKIYLKNL